MEALVVVGQAPKIDADDLRKDRGRPERAQRALGETDERQVRRRDFVIEKTAEEISEQSHHGQPAVIQQGNARRGLGRRSPRSFQQR